MDKYLIGLTIRDAVNSAEDMGLRRLSKLKFELGFGELIILVNPSRDLRGIPRESEVMLTPGAKRRGDYREIFLLCSARDLKRTHLIGSVTKCLNRK